MQIVFIAAVCICLPGVGVWSIVTDLRQTLDQASQRNARAADVLAIQIANTVANTDFRIGAVLPRLADLWFDDPALFESRHGRVLRALAARADAIDSLVAISPDGTAVWSTTEPIIGADLSDRAYFKVALSAPGGALVTGAPIISRGTSRRLTPIAWPVRDVAGNLRGVLAASLDSGFFNRYLEDLTLDAGMRLEVATESGQTVFESDPDLQEEEHARIDAASPSRIAAALGLAGAEAQLRADAAIRGLGFRVSVTQEVKAATQSWRRRAGVVLVLTLALSVIVAIAALQVRRREAALTRSMERAKSDEMSARRAQEEFEAIFENVGDSVVIFDEDRSFARVSKAALRLFGARDPQAAVVKLVEVFPELSEADRSRRRELSARSLRTVMGDERVVACAASRIVTGGRETLFCILRDLTQERRLERTRARFIASVNHELRTPLTSLKGSLDLFSRHFNAGLEKDAATLIDLSRRNADRLLNLVNDVLTVQAIDADGLSLEPAPLPAGAAAAEAWESMGGYASSFSVELRLVDDVGDAMISADRGRLQQVLVNLISNAIKFSPRDGVVRLVAAREGDEVSFAVCDEGPGVPVQLRGRLFERFTQDRASVESRALPGTGLGLAISRELTVRMGGRIAYATATREEAGAGGETGTTFTVTFPVLAEAARPHEETT